VFFGVPRLYIDLAAGVVFTDEQLQEIEAW
jgi:hypothetical protein